MVHLFIGTHAALGELGAIGFLWVLIELLNPTDKRIARARIIAAISVVLIFLSWFTGGYYYVNLYGPIVKPIINEGPRPWAHAIFMETKEHVFLFLPFLSLLTFSVINKYRQDLIKNSKLRKSTIALCLIIFLLALAMGIMGYLISAGARAALEVKAI